MRIIPFILVALPAALLLCGCPTQTADKEITVFVYGGPTSGLKHTEVVASFESPLLEGKNIIWCAAMTAAWKELARETIGEPIRLEGAEEPAQSLNSSPVSEEDFDPDSYYAAAGMATEEFIESVRKSMSEKFPEVVLPEMEADESFLLYSYLSIHMTFPEPYRFLEEGMTFTDSAGESYLVNGFGDFSGSREMMTILFYYADEENPDAAPEFAVDLWATSEPYQVVLACVERRETLAATFDHVTALAAEFPEGGEYRAFNDNDSFEAPDHWWELEHNYAEVEDRPLLNAGWEQHFISSARQDIAFKLDRKGVVLEVQTYYEGGVTAVAPVESGREFIFDRPYLIYIKKRDAANPIFAVWVDNAELLAKR